jgi:hypothetical protein
VNIFISHSSADNKIVDKIIKVFNRYYIDYWVDLAQIENPDNIIGKINLGLRNATHCLLVWSNEALTSEWVQKEVNAVSSSDYNNIKKFSFK